MASRPKSIRCAAVQTGQQYWDKEGNIARAAPLIKEAASKGAKLILLPELFAGYAYTSSFWETAERIPEGQSCRFLCELAATLQVHVGACILEADGEHFFNTFILAGPSGEVLGTVRKQQPAALEALYFAPCVGPHVIDCTASLGLRVGVGICYENQVITTHHRMPPPPATTHHHIIYIYS